MTKRLIGGPPRHIEIVRHRPAIAAQTLTEVKIAKLQKQAADAYCTTEVIKAIINNPILEFIAGLVAVHYLVKNGNAVVQGVEQATSMTAITTLIGAQQLAPSLPYLTPVVHDVVSMVGNIAGKAASGVAAGAAGG